MIGGRNRLQVYAVPAYITLLFLLLLLCIPAGLTLFVWGLLQYLRPRPAPAPSAEEILRRRFAQGELDATEYASMLGTLQGKDG